MLAAARGRPAPRVVLAGAPSSCFGAKLLTRHQLACFLVYFLEHVHFFQIGRQNEFCINSIIGIITSHNSV
jgi:hypothetical protein